VTLSKSLLSSTAVTNTVQHLTGGYVTRLHEDHFARLSRHFDPPHGPKDAQLNHFPLALLACRDRARLQHVATPTSVWHVKERTLRTLVDQCTSLETFNCAGSDSMPLLVAAFKPADELRGVLEDAERQSEWNRRRVFGAVLLGAAFSGNVPNLEVLVASGVHKRVARSTVLYAISLCEEKHHEKAVAYLTEVVKEELHTQMGLLR
jgi:hypothetical protein